MNKKILVGLIVAMMIVAGFTACDNSVPTYKTVNYISMAQVKDVLYGQAFTGDMVEITVHYTDGSVETVSGAGYASGTNSGTSAFDVDASYAGETAKISVTPVAPESATIEAVAKSREVTTTQPTVDGNVELASWTMTVTGGENGSFTVKSTDTQDDYTVTAGKIPAADKGTVGEYTVALTAAYKTIAITTDSTVTVEVYDDTPVAKPVVGVAPFYKVGSGDELSQAEFNATQLYIGDTVQVRFYTVDADGEKVGTALSLANAATAATPATAEVISNSFGTLSSSQLPNVASVSATTNAEATISYVYTDAETKVSTRYTATAKVGAGVNTISDVVSVAAKNNLTASNTITRDSFDVTIKTLLDPTTGHVVGAEAQKENDKDLVISWDVEESGVVVPASDAETGAIVHVLVTYESRGTQFKERFTVTGIKAAATQTPGSN